MTFGKIGATPTMKRWTARDYVQSGLVLHFDGIENYGYGQHSDSQIVDLVTGNPISLFDYVVGANTIRWTIEKDRISSLSVWDGAWGTSYMSASIRASQSLAELYNSASRITLEAIFRGVSQVNSRIYLFGWTNNGASWRLWQRTWGGTDGASSGFGLNKVNCCSLVDDFDAGQLLSYDSGVMVKTASSTGRTSYNIATGDDVSLPIGSNGYYSCKQTDLWTLRLYSRALSAAEIARNYDIDKLRFGLP